MPTNLRISSWVFLSAISSCLAIPVHGATDVEIKNAILERTSPTVEQLRDMDTNGDGRVDIADAVKTASTPEVNFASSTSTVVEGGGHAEIIVNFDRPFNGSLNYTIANLNVDVNTNATLAVNGSSAKIRIDVSDDAEDKDATVLEVAIATSADKSYAPGRSILHTLTIMDNDGRWTGSYILDGVAGTLDLDITFLNGVATGGLLGSGDNLIPNDTCNTAAAVTPHRWPASTFSLTPSVFAAEFQEIQGCVQVTSGFASKLQRTLRFQAGVPVANSPAGAGGAIYEGKLTEVLIWPTAPYLNRTTEGTFRIAKRVSRVDPPPPKRVPIVP